MDTDGDGLGSGGGPRVATPGGIVFNPVSVERGDPVDTVCAALSLHALS